jgi:hypothetical protein
MRMPSLVTLHRKLWKRVANGEDQSDVFEELWEEHEVYNKYPDYLGASCFLCVHMRYHGNNSCNNCPGRWELYALEEGEEKVHCIDGLYGAYTRTTSYTQEGIEERRKLALRIMRCADKPRKTKQRKES